MFSFVALDLETTGLDCWSDDIIEIGLVKVIEGQETDVFQSLVRPRGALPVKIKRLTGLKDEELLSAPEIQEIIPDILQFTGELPFVGHTRYLMKFMTPLNCPGYCCLRHPATAWANFVK